MSMSKEELRALVYSCTAEIQTMLQGLPGMPEVYEEIISMIRLHAYKSVDYSGDTGDPLFNFRMTAFFNHCSLKDAVRHYICGKFTRLLALDNETEAMNEPVEDTLIDMALYLVIERALRRRLGNAFFSTDSNLLLRGDFNGQEHDN